MSTADENETPQPIRPNDAPPAYTPYSSTCSISQISNPTMQFITQEKQLLQILGIASLILGMVSIFMSVLAVVFNTFMYCTGTGFWGGTASVVNGILILMRSRERNTPCLVRTMFLFTLIALVASIISIILPILGTTSSDGYCCKNTSNNFCNVGASQITNTALSAMAFTEMVLALMTAVIFSKYIFPSCNSNEYYHDNFNYDYFDENNTTYEGGIRFRMW